MKKDKTMYHLDATIWGVPVTLHASSSILDWVYNADSDSSYRHRKYMLMQHIIRHRHFEIKREVK